MAAPRNEIKTTDHRPIKGDYVHRSEYVKLASEVRELKTSCNIMRQQINSLIKDGMKGKPSTVRTVKVDLGLGRLKRFKREEPVVKIVKHSFSENKNRVFIHVENEGKERRIELNEFIKHGFETDIDYYLNRLSNEDAKKIREKKQVGVQSLV